MTEKGRQIRKSIRGLVPRRMLKRPIDHRGYPVPWFVTVKDDDGNWDFRPVEPERIAEAVHRKKCWICGERLGVHVAFAVGPMCGVNRISGEPPQHQACAEFAVKACPFMLLPMAKRRTSNLPEGTTENPGAIKRNPGVTLVWSTAKFEVIPNAPGCLWGMGEPTALSFWVEGRPATRAEIDKSVQSGLPTLVDLAKAESPLAEMALESMTKIFMDMLPA